MEVRMCVSTAYARQRQDNQELKAKLASWIWQGCLKQTTYLEGGGKRLGVCDLG